MLFASVLVIVNVHVVLVVGGDVVVIVVVCSHLALAVTCSHLALAVTDPGIAESSHCAMMSMSTLLYRARVNNDARIQSLLNQCDILIGRILFLEKNCGQGLLQALLPHGQLAAHRKRWSYHGVLRDGRDFGNWGCCTLKGRAACPCRIAGFVFFAATSFGIAGVGVAEHTDQGVQWATWLEGRACPLRSDCIHAG